MDMLFSFVSLPMNELNNIFTLAGAIVGVVSGLIIGRFNLYIKLNNTNNFSADTEYKANEYKDYEFRKKGKQRRPRDYSLLVIGILLFVFGMVFTNLSHYIDGPSKGIMVLFGVIFTVGAVPAFVVGIKALNSKKNEE